MLLLYMSFLRPGDAWKFPKMTQVCIERNLGQTGAP